MTDGNSGGIELDPDADDQGPGAKPIEEISDVVIRLAGDSGDGMQLTGNQFTAVSALAGNDLATLPDFPAEIRAPAGTMPGVSAFQVHISSQEVTTPGDAANVLVAMNPAALRSELPKVIPGGTVIVNTDAFGERDLAKAGYDANPLENGELEGYSVVEVPMTSLTANAVKELGVKARDAERSKNFFALGLLCWMYHRNPEDVQDWITDRFAKKEQVLAANMRAFEVGLAFGETTELIPTTQLIAPVERDTGTYTNIAGNTALAWGLIAAGQLSGLPIFLGSYPITPASDILHELARYPQFSVRTFQAEDEIAACTSAIGAAFAGDLAITTTSGPGLSLKAEAIGLAVSLELPLVVVNIQRGGPSTGLPTKTEQADLLQAMFGRHGESPVPVVAASRPVGLLRRRHRGRPHRPQVPDAGDPAVGRLPGQLGRTVEAARRRHAAGPVGRVRDGDQPHQRRRDPGVLALPPGPGHPGAALGRARHAGPGAPHRRHREGRRVR